MANAATPGYSRQIARLIPIQGGNTISGFGVGAGVQIGAIHRQIDEAVEARLRTATADSSFARVQADVLSQIEDTLGELGDNDLSSRLTGFFRVWSERANQTPSGTAVVQQGAQLASFIRTLRSDLADQRRLIDQQLSGAVARSNELLSSIAQANGQISAAEVGGNVANALRDQRDALVRELSDLMDVTVIDRGREGMDLLAGSTPVVLGSVSRGVVLRSDTLNGETSVSVAVRDDGMRLDVASGRLGGLLSQRTSSVDEVIGKLDALAARVIHEVNRLHSTGTNAAGLRSASGTLAFTAPDRTRPLSDPDNSSIANAPFRPVSGGFLVHTRHAATGTEQTIRIDVDLDGITDAGTSGTGDDTSLDDIRAALSAIPGLAATITPDGRLRIDASEGTTFSFADDSSGVLATLGVNSFFTGVNASDIAVRNDLLSDATNLCAGRLVNGVFVENGTALEIAGLQTAGLASLQGRSIPDLWRDAVERVGADASGAFSRAQSASIVADSLEAQRAAVSGVSVDEESINLLESQRQYQAAARLISVCQQMTDTLLQML